LFGLRTGRRELGRSDVPLVRSNPTSGSGNPAKPDAIARNSVCLACPLHAAGPVSVGFSLTRFSTPAKFDIHTHIGRKKIVRIFYETLGSETQDKTQITVFMPNLTIGAKHAC
jgi:hypothetical protein